MNRTDLRSTGPDTRREVLGDAYVAAGLAGSDESMTSFQDVVSELAWGYAWSRPGLDRRSRPILALRTLAVWDATRS